MRGTFQHENQCKLMGLITFLGFREVSFRKTFEGVEREFSGEKIVYKESELSGNQREQEKKGEEKSERARKEMSRLGEITLFNAKMDQIGDTANIQRIDHGRKKSHF